MLSFIFNFHIFVDLVNYASYILCMCMFFLFFVALGLIGVMHKSALRSASSCEVVADTAL